MQYHYFYYPFSQETSGEIFRKDRAESSSVGRFRRGDSVSFILVEAAFVRSTFQVFSCSWSFRWPDNFVLCILHIKKKLCSREGREKWALMIPVFSFLSAAIAASFEFITYVMLFEFQQQLGGFLSCCYFLEC